ncbi:hypothetical protein HMI54_014632 [Coelomomyces lativittatus]|nr:hypothetical protein HMI56_000067 [Coelomomyces lativittatus]KAJ1513866.1 hypothetical protein HMI54_014632 [Coelomomyces lativittatus]KAJ1516993.1 hypothetical protein HMI55_000890 [Coelomomyces lativittatus]
MLLNFLNLILLNFVFFNFAFTENEATEFDEIQMVESLENPQNPVYNRKLEVPYSIITNEEKAKSYLTMLYDIVQFEGELQLQLELILPFRQDLKTTRFGIYKQWEDYFKLGAELFKFEKELNANLLQLNSNSNKQHTVSSQLNEKLFKKKDLWKCKNDMDRIVKNIGYKANLLCFLMAYKIKMVIAKAHPDIFKILKKSRVEEGKLKLLATLDEERIFFIQYSESNLNQFFFFFN